MEKWLKQGKQSYFSDKIIKTANNHLGRNNIETIYKLANFTRSLKHRETQNESWECFFTHHMKRSADEILSSGYTIDCMEVGLLTATMARSVGIPVKIVQTVDIYSYLENPESSFAGSGHVYLEFYTTDKCRYFTNPGKTMAPIINKDSYKTITCKRGAYFHISSFTCIDPIDAGIKDHNDFLEKQKEAAEKFLVRLVKGKRSS